MIKQSFFKEIDELLEKDGHKPEPICIRAEETIYWPAVCVRCGKSGELTTEVAEFIVPLRFVKREEPFPFIAADTYQTQHFKPPYCNDCAKAIRKYSDVSQNANFLGWVGGIAWLWLIVGLGLLSDTFIGKSINSLVETIFGNNQTIYVLLLMVHIVFSIFAGFGINRWYRNWKGNPVKAIEGVEITFPTNVYETTRISFMFLNKAYRELFTRANQSATLTPSSDD